MHRRHGARGYEADNFGVRCTDCIECAKESSGKIAGVDICGEADAEAVHENEANDYANEKLLEVLKVYLGNPTVNNK